MRYNQLGNTGMFVSELCLGTMTFGDAGQNAQWGLIASLDQKGVNEIVARSIAAGVNFFDTADVYSDGVSEQVLGEALKGRRDKVLISTKATFRFSDAPNDVGSSRFHLLKSCDEALKRLQTDHIDIFQLHGFDAMTPPEEVLSTLDQLVRAGKIRYVGVSNFSGWHLMKSLAVADRYGYPRYVANQTYYSLLGRDYEWELMPLGLDQGVGALIWSPLGWGRLTGKIRRGQPLPETSRLHQTADKGPPIDDERLFRIVDVLDEIAKETGKSIPQIALNWLFQRPTVSSVIIGARDEKQLKDNLGAIGWNLTPEQIAKLDAASETTKPYPYWHQSGFSERNPSPV